DERETRRGSSRRALRSGGGRPEDAHGLLDRVCGAGGNAAAGHRTSEQGDRCRPRRAGDQEAVGRARPRAGRQHARASDQARRRRNPALGRGGQSGQHQAGLRQAVMSRPLRNVRVLDLTNVLAGPFCCHQLAHLGADVIKVETPGTGDLARQLGADAELNRTFMGVSFLAQNAGKRSITVNLKRPRGKEVFRRLAGSAAVVAEIFRPGVMEPLGLGYAALRAEQPKLVYCAISGFGQDGPLRDLPAYDQIVQGMSGMMSITGAPETAPYRVGYPVADTIGGMTAAFAIAAALASRDRSEGCFIDVSMLEAAIATMGWAVSNHLIAGRAPTPMGNENVTASPSGT